MTREQAKILLKLTNDELKNIGHAGLALNRKIAEAYANGAEIEYLSKNGNWLPCADCEPFFTTIDKYRVKPAEPQESTEKWKPRNEEGYFYVEPFGSGDCSIERTLFCSNDETDNERVAIGNCFKIWTEARDASNKLATVLKAFFAGEQPNAQTPVESLDGNPLSDGEKALIRELRKTEVLKVFAKRECCVVFKDEENNLLSNAIYDVVFRTSNTPCNDDAIRDALRKIKDEKETAK